MRADSLKEKEIAGGEAWTWSEVCASVYGYGIDVPGGNEEE